MIRAFNCPETDERCTDGRCTKELCCEREKIKVGDRKKQGQIEAKEFWKKYWEKWSPYNW
jgi:hypothetical protein